MKAFIERVNVKNKDWCHIIRRISFMIILVFILTGVSSMNACGFFDSASWKEEVLLHDGSKIIVKRWQKRGGPHTLGERHGILEYSITFKHPDTKKMITWKDGPTEDIQYANFDPVALHIIGSIPYIITMTGGCKSFNKWGRPNPPYVIFKYEGNDWKRIDLADLPPEIKTVNIVLSTLTHEEILTGTGFITAEKVKELNSNLKEEMYKTIVRMPFKQEGPGCPELIYCGKSQWLGVDFFKTQSSYKECVKFCNSYGMSSESCPCKRFFNNTKGE